MKAILIGVTIDDSLQFHTGIPELLVEDGWDVHVVAGPGRRIEALRVVPGVTVHVLPMTREPRPLKDLISFFAWVRVLKLVRPQTTLIGTPKAALLGNLAARLLRIPHRIYLLHGLRLETATGLQRHVLLFLEKVTSRNAHETIAVSESLKRLAINLGVARKDKIVVLGNGSCNGIDLEKFSASAMSEGQKLSLAKEVGLNLSVPIIGFVGRITRDKGLPELAEALRMLRSRGMVVQLLIVGSVDDESGKAALAELSETKQTIVAVGYREDPAPFYRLMDVFCLPSLREGMPGVVLEAMASRTVVVGTDATGIVDVLEHRVTGLVVRRGSAHELADALSECISRENNVLEFTENAFTMVTNRFDAKFVQARLRKYLLGEVERIRE